MPGDQRIITELESTRNATLEYFALPEEMLDRNYGQNKWSVRFILHHLADTETFYYDRIRRILSEPEFIHSGFNERAWAHGLDYSRLPLILGCQTYASARAALIYLARLHYETSAGISFTHRELGIQTLRHVFDKVVSHNEKHLGHIRLALSD